MAPVNGTLYCTALLRIVQCHLQVFAHCGSQFCYQKGSFFSPPLFTERLFDWLNVGFHSLDSAGKRSYARRRGGMVAEKKNITSSVYDCTVEDVEHSNAEPPSCCYHNVAIITHIRYLLTARLRCDVIDFACRPPHQTKP